MFSASAWMSRPAPSSVRTIARAAPTTSPSRSDDEQPQQLAELVGDRGEASAHGRSDEILSMRGRSAMAAVPVRTTQKPCRCYAFFPVALVPVHRRKALAENVDAGEAAPFEDFAAAFGSRNARRSNRTTNGQRTSACAVELFGNPERRVCQDALAAVRCAAFKQEVARSEVCGIAVVGDVAREHLMSGDRATR